MGILRKKRLWIGTVAVAIPLVALLILQFQWLTRLESTSAIAQRASLSNYIRAVASEVEYFYRSQAERALNIPDEIVRQPEDRLAPFLRKKELEGVSSVFVARYDAQTRSWDRLELFDPATGELSQAPSVETLSAINVALAPWEMLADKGEELTKHPLTVEERDSRHRMIVNAISDDACRIVGVAGLMIDVDYFRESMLPGALKGSLPEYFDESTQQGLLIVARDRDGEAVIGPQRLMDEEEQVTDALTFVFSDWTLGLGMRGETAEQLARTNFLVNTALTVLLAMALIGAIAFTLRNATRAVRLSEMKSDFVSNVSHELRTPLASIRVFGELLRHGRSTDPNKTKQYGEYIENESHRLTQLINNILDFSKIESGAKSYVSEPTRVDLLAAELVGTLEVGLAHQGATLRFEPPSDPIPEIAADPAALRQALANLIDNAVKYSPEAPDVTVAVTADGTHLKLSVTDRGIGISKDEQAKIFERFHRVGSSLVHDVKGSGLGLAIVHHIVAAHGGEIQVDSEPGAGSRFTIVLPLGRGVVATGRLEPQLGAS